MGVLGMDFLSVMLGTLFLVASRQILPIDLHNLSSVGMVLSLAGG
jgi:hypothetical protein